MMVPSTIFSDYHESVKNHIGALILVSNSRVYFT